MMVAQLAQTSPTADQQRKAQASVGDSRGPEMGWFDDLPGWTTVANVT
jgi:hypothetical protein